VWQASIYIGARLCGMLLYDYGKELFDIIFFSMVWRDALYIIFFDGMARHFFVPFSFFFSTWVWREAFPSIPQLLAFILADLGDMKTCRSY